MNFRFGIIVACLLSIPLAHSAAWAGGFLCRSTEDNSPNLQAKLYDQTHPAPGTRNPTVLVVYSARSILAVVYGDHMTKEDLGSSFVLGGPTTQLEREPETRNFTYAGLTLQKRPNIDGYTYGLLHLDEQTIGVVCSTL